MKYLVLLCDGMADHPLPQLGDQTPMTVANKPMMNRLAAEGEVGMVQTVPDGYSPGSDVANLSAMGYAPEQYYTGRSPLEAASIGIEMAATDLAFRCNLVTVSEEANYADKTLLDYCADDISTEEAAELVKALKAAFDDETYCYYDGVSYRHCLIWKEGPKLTLPLTPPHDITGRPVKEYLPCEETASPLLAMMEKSYHVLKDHPINVARMAAGKRPANSIWLWGNGFATTLPTFESVTGLKGAVISAVDLLKGIGKLGDMTVVEVEGATGYIDTNFSGKAQACIDAFADHDFVYLHVEAPDECGHRFEIAEKVKSLELIDEQVLTPIVTALAQYDDYKIMILPDHATPLALKTHTSEPVPYLIYQKSKQQKSGVAPFDEVGAGAFPCVPDGKTLMQHFLQG